MNDLNGVRKELQEYYKVVQQKGYGKYTIKQRKATLRKIDAFLNEKQIDDMCLLETVREDDFKLFLKRTAHNEKAVQWYLTVWRTMIQYFANKYTVFPVSPAVQDIPRSYDLLLEKYVDYLVMRNFKKRGIEGKLWIAQRFVDYAVQHGFDIICFSVKDAEEYRNYLHVRVDDEGNPWYNSKTINCMVTNLKVFYKFLLSLGTVYKNPFLYVERLKEIFTLPKNILSIEQMELLLDSFLVENKRDLKLKVLLEVLYSTAARISEIENLHREDIHLEDGYIQIRDDKERQDRKAVLTEYSTRLLRLYLEYVYDGAHDTVFYHGQPRSLNRWINDNLKRQCNRLNLPVITCHGIRHCTATHLLKKGADLREVSEFLGHKRIKNTEIYVRISPEDLKTVVDQNHPREIIR